MKKESSPKMHVSLFVTDIDKSISFYNNLFNTSPVKIKSDYLKYELSDPSLVISFIQNETNVCPDFGHLGFRLDSPESIAKFKKGLENKIDIQSEEVENPCCYAIQDKFWVEDPDGYKWEVYYFHRDSEENDQCCKSEHKPSGEMEAPCCATSAVCC